MSSQTFNMTGLCNGLDMVYRWSINNRNGAQDIATPPVLTVGGLAPFVNWPAEGEAGSSFIYPFTADPILITGVEIVIIPPAPGAVQMPGWPAPPPGGLGGSLGPYLPSFCWLMIGNNYDGDCMMFMSPNEKNLRQVMFYPPGNEFKFPGWNSPDTSNMKYIDLHGNGTSGYMANLFLNFYYKKVEQ